MSLQFTALAPCIKYLSKPSRTDWSNVVAAGSSALLPLLPRRDDVELIIEPDVEDELEAYYQSVHHL
jgi:hypothetical protein